MKKRQKEEPNSNGKRMNGNYEIIENCTFGNNELVIGYNPKAPSPYVCWYCDGGNNYYWGYYCNELSEARNKLNERYQTECDISHDKSKGNKKTIEVIDPEQEEKVKDIEEITEDKKKVKKQSKSR